MALHEIFSQIPLFSGLSPQQIDELAMIVTDQEFRKGQPIFSEGDEGVGFYVVITGLVKIFKLSMDGKEQILHIFGPGEPFAEVAVFTGSPYPAHAEALQNSRVFFFPRKSFSELIANNPTLAMKMLAALSMRLKKFANMIENLSLKEVPGRLAAHLLYLSSQKENSDNLRLNIPKSQLASLLGTIPETLSRILARMDKQGLLSIDGPSITILDRESLEELASGEVKLG